MGAKRVKLSMTLTEAASLLQLAEEAEVETFGDDWRRSRAAIRGMDKLGQSIAAATRPRHE